MTKFTEFVATANGTVSTKRIPYRFLEKGQKIDLNEEEAEFYKNSKWLLPYEKARNIPEPPLMSHTMRIVEKNSLNPAQMLPSSATQPEGYNSQIRAITEREANEDGKKHVEAKEAIAAAVAQQNQAAAASTVNPGGETAQGTGNKDVLA